MAFVGSSGLALLNGCGFRVGAFSSVVGRRDVGAGVRSARSRAMTVRMMSASEEQSGSRTTTDSSSEVYSLDGSESPQWIQDMNLKLQEYKEQLTKSVEGLDADKVTAGGKKLVDNLIQGEWLSRGEVFGGIQLALLYFLLQDSRMMDGLANFLFGPICLLAGGAVCVKAFVDLGISQISIWPKPAPGAELRTDGLYQYVRHPIYAGVLLASLGWAGATHSPSRFLLTLGFAYFFARKIAVEEEFLEETYEGYKSYKEAVPFKLIPRIF
uniref:Protein-S-isoprenylcysteine O-methyltransferase n=1 Tax=Compsopogon caeruleus TaxID=31354 RepID=A0A7S1TEK5_9RHOD|mmetsp:Transcript_2528/g.4379  ORF Transcript_2528/g.4379 Transcript_2528/m.4379 type:complete len:269 (+) Transcript_2528:113-919(+)|eukprot:CAMPEP_0184682046 /NCGR_PEP_ID=MMETSP0312-20130426/5581_1 /TAXON_ID=31354 /ORGANISM="Compsopogon coeruleus, Strain SAG 36.94" /LENGTH=268 /DNA_ID=CAMNT_0027133349 /DNA_START=51 /DNA_END=857 /DNA_ORIENTATION=+